MSADKIIENDVRGVKLRLVGYTRALKLCARMNRETEVLDFIDLIKPGEVLYDLGACEGRFALYAALRGVQCFAFEPETLNYEAILKNIALNMESEKFLTPLKYAVGERGHRTVLKIAQPWAGGHQRVISDVSDRIDLKFDFISEQTVEVVALDEFIATNELPQPNYLKIDIDGSELPFVNGAQKTLSHNGLKRIIIELHQDDLDSQNVESFIGACGFVLINRYEVETGLFNVLFERQFE